MPRQGLQAPTFSLEAQTNIEALLLLRRDFPLRRDGLLLLLFWLHLRRMGAAVRYIMPERGSKLLAVVGEDLRVVCAARDGNVGHAVTRVGCRGQGGRHNQGRRGRAWPLVLRHH